MPAKDRHHDKVVRALEKDGWRITSEQVFLMLDERRVWVDMRAHRNGETILVEVKGFETTGSIVEYLAGVVGQYVMYAAIIDYLGMDIPLFLAVPAAAIDGILGEVLGKLVVETVHIQLLIVDVESESVIRWQK